jgi:CubicO group peptidase (beta-lactamase class C family)
MQTGGVSDTMLRTQQGARLVKLQFVHLALALLLVAAAPATQAADPAPAAIDKLFAAWDKPDTPGLALAVVRDGRIVHSKGYGQANLEYGVANTPATVFHAASLSKQFTAFAIHLLAQEGKLSLDDPVKKYVPEMQVDSSTPITIRHLLHHTSGLRDQWDLLTLAGLRLDDGITDNDILGLLWQQKQLNFAPGQDYLYSNSGYSLLGLIVRRVSGQSLAAFTRERIFTPLGMKNTRFQESYGTLVKNRAYSYVRGREGYSYRALSYSNTGATSLFTTVEDLALWNANYDQPKVGDAATVAAMQVTAKLADGRDTFYGSGLFIGPYRGVPVVDHTGSDAGYRAYYLRLPQQKLAVLMLGNAADLNAFELGRKVADLYLEGQPGVQPPRVYPPEVEVTARELAPLAGDYEFGPGRLVSLIVEQGRLYAISGGPRTALSASGANEFFARTTDLRISFPPVVGNAPPSSAVWKTGARELPLKRLVRESPSAEVLQACVGDYYSEELRTVYSFEMRNGKLMVRYPRGVLELRPVNRDVFIAGYPLGVLTMRRDAAGKCQGFDATTGRVRNLKFELTKGLATTAQSR